MIVDAPEGQGIYRAAPTASMRSRGFQGRREEKYVAGSIRRLVDPGSLERSYSIYGSTTTQLDKIFTSAN